MDEPAQPAQPAHPGSVDESNSEATDSTDVRDSSAGTHPRFDTHASHGPAHAVVGRVKFRWFVAAALALLFVAGFGGYQLGAADGNPQVGSAEVGFARDMQTHHNQAVQMSLIVRDKTTDPTLRAIAYDIATSQQQQAGQMYGWLTQWELPQTGTDPAMTWMSATGHGDSRNDDPMAPPTDSPTSTAATTPSSTPTSTAGGMDGMDKSAQPGPEPTSGTSSGDGAATMMGMATPAQLTALERSTGAAAERLFLQLMITHHRGGVAMAKAALERAEEPVVRNLAQAITTAQTAEIAQLQTLLDART